MSSSNPSTAPGGQLRGNRRSLAVGLIVVAALAAAVAVVASTSPSVPTPAGPVDSASGPPCTDRSGVCLAPDVCPPPTHQYTAQDLDRIRPDVDSMIDDAFYGVGTGLH